MIAPEAAHWLRMQGLDQMQSRAALGASVTSHVSRYNFLADDSGAQRSVIWKEQPGMSFDFFQSEADGLAALRACKALRVPQVYFVSETGILMEDLRPAVAGNNYWEALGQGLAAIHSHQAPTFGFSSDNYCGLGKQQNQQTDDGHDFFGQHRLLVQAKWANARGLLSNDSLNDLHRICAKLAELIPPNNPVLLHGDLWSGNVIADDQGDPALIDPAAYWGWHTTDLAMSTLFGGLADRFYDAYQEAYGCNSDWRTYSDLLNLYHHLNHLNLFGLTYLDRVDQTIARYR